MVLCEGLQHLGVEVFAHCSLEKGIQIPSTITKIGYNMFYETLLPCLHLHDGIESIGFNTCCKCIFTKCRLPPLITTLPSVFRNCKGIFSIELPDSISQIESGAFAGCLSLRNISIPQNNEVDEPPQIALDVFVQCTDLKRVFDTDEQIIHALKHRFDNLPIHKMIIINHIIT